VLFVWRHREEAKGQGEKHEVTMESRNHPEVIQLSYTQAKTIADAIEPIRKAKKNRANVANFFGVKEHVIQRLLACKAKTRIARESFETVVAKLGMDTQGWDIRREV